MPLGADVSLGFLRFKNAVSGTIASGELTVSQSFMTVSSESGTTDNLDTLTVDTDLTMPSDYVELVMLRAATGHTITIRDAQDNIVTNSGNNFAFTDVQVALLLRVAADQWVCLNG